MKTLLKLYKMFYRLLRLKSSQREQIRRDSVRDFYLFENRLGKERDELRFELYKWEHLAKMYGVVTPEGINQIIKELIDKLAKAEDTPSNFNRLVKKYNKFIELKQEFCEKFKDIELDV